MGKIIKHNTYHTAYSLVSADNFKVVQLDTNQYSAKQGTLPLVVDSLIDSQILLGVRLHKEGSQCKCIVPYGRGFAGGMLSSFSSVAFRKEHLFHTPTSDTAICPNICVLDFVTVRRLAQQHPSIKLSVCACSCRSESQHWQEVA